MLTEKEVDLILMLEIGIEEIKIATTVLLR
jgi:hypothetical protein